MLEGDLNVNVLSYYTDAGTAFMSGVTAAELVKVPFITVLLPPFCGPFTDIPPPFTALSLTFHRLSLPFH